MRFLNVVMSLVFALGLLGCANSSQSADDASGNTPSGRNVFLVDQDHKTLLSLGEPSVLLGGDEENWRCLASYDLDVNDNGPQWRQLAEKVASKMDGLMIVATMDSGAEYQWELVQGE